MFKKWTNINFLKYGTGSNVADLSEHSNKGNFLLHF